MGIAGEQRLWDGLGAKVVSIDTVSTTFPLHDASLVENCLHVCTAEGTT